MQLDSATLLLPASAGVTALVTGTYATMLLRQRAALSAESRVALRQAGYVVGVAVMLCVAGVVRLSAPGLAWGAVLSMLGAGAFGALIVRTLADQWLEIVLDAAVTAVAGTLLVYEALLILRPLIGPIPNGPTQLSDVLCVTFAAWFTVFSYIVRRSAPQLLIPPNLLLLLAWVALTLSSRGRPSFSPLLIAIALAGAIAGYGVIAFARLRLRERSQLLRAPSANASWRAFLLSAAAILVAMTALPIEPQLSRPIVYVLVGLAFLVVTLRQLAALHDLREVGGHVQAREQRFRNLLADSTDVIMICDAAGRIEYISPAAENVLGRGGAVEGQAVWEVLAIPENAFRTGLARIEIDGGTALLEGRKGDKILEAAISRRGRELLASIRDVTERDRLRQRLHFMAYHDPLTGLVNRSRVLARIAAMTERDERCAVLFVDLDHFKQVNDNSGHDVGDQVLKQVARRLSDLIADGDLIGRLGGDEFVAVTGADETRAQDIAANFAAVMAEPFEVAGRSYQLGASIGIAMGGSGSVPEELLRRADLAMYEAKRTRQSRVVYQPSMADAALEQVNVEVAVSRAIRERTMEIHLQPLVDLATGRVVTVEALLRWRDTTGRLGAPGEMLDYARRSGRLAELTDWVLKESLVIASRSPGVSLAVNMPPDILITPDLPSKLHRMLADYGVDPRRLELEVAEDQLLETTSAIHAVQALRDVGVSLLIDDFGTGFSSLGYLVDVPMDGLKIDQRFTRALQTSEAARSIVAGLVSISNRLQLRVVAEGIETPDLHRWASDLGVQIGQGYWYGRPESSTTLADPADLRSWRSSEAALFLSPAATPEQTFPHPRGGSARSSQLPSTTRTTADPQ